jgi:DNA-binding SARP family transcriptional activator/tetratricopeptide (TPR) repeat protein
VRVDGARVSVGGPRSQAILAALLLRPGERVPADSLIDVVWGEEPPPTARAALQVHVSKLRRHLDEHGFGAIVETHGSAYAIAVGPHQLDVTSFRRSLEQGRAHLGAGDIEGARTALAEALALWRGSPLAGLELPGLPPGAIQELEDLHDLTVLLRLEAELGSGRGLEIVPELLQLRAARPLDERVAELAALALVRGGRQADALAELATLRRDLSEELGMEPGPAIGELERRILAADPALLPALEEEVPARERRKTVTVVALRVPAGEPEDVRAAIDSLQEPFERVVAGLDGWCPPARSGRLVGVFGVPSTHEDDAGRAVTAADALRRAAIEEEVQAKLGVATGEVLAEIGGEDVRLLSHDPVELADRLARAASAGQVLVGITTCRLAQAVAAVDPAPIEIPVDERGPVLAHPLREVADARTARRLAAPLVGREHELLRLRDAAQRALSEQRPALVTVLGPAGIGKSRLVDEFAAGSGDRVEVAVGRCLPYGKDIGMWPAAEVVRALAGIRVGAPGATARRRLRALLGDEPDADILGEQLGWFVGLAERSPAPDETSWAIRRLLEIVARRRPLVVVMEDLQWADDALLDLLAYVSSSANQVPLAIVCCARPELLERHPTWGTSGADAVTIRLEPLEPTEADDLLGRLLGTRELAEAVRERIAAAAEGNPLFLEEVLSMLIDDGHLRESEGGWEPTIDLTDVPLPPTVKALLEARVDRLPPAEREVAEAAAIIGREFADEDLEDLRPDADAGDVAAALDALCRRDLLELRRFSRPGSRSYAFRHILIHDVVYGAVPRDRRAQDHELFGRALAERSGDRLAEVQEIVGYHLETAYRLLPAARVDVALGALAATHLGAAGRRAFLRDDSVAAESLFSRALACVGSDDRRHGELARLRAAALFDLGRFVDAEDVLREGLEAAERAGDRALVWRLRLEAAQLDVYLRPGERLAADVQVFAEEGIAALRDLGDVAGLARAHRLLGEALTLQGHLDEGIEAFVEGARLAEQAGDEREVSLSEQLMGLHGTTPVPVFAGRCERLVADAPYRPRPEVVMRLAFARALGGDDDASRRLIEEGLAYANEVGGGFRVADAEMYAGMALLHLGDPSGAARALERSVATLEGLGERNLRSTAVAYLGEALVRLGEIDRADAAAEQSRSLAAEDDGASQMLWRQVRAKVLAARGDLGGALELAREAASIADGTEFLTMKAAAHVDLSVLLDADGSAQDATRERKVAMEIFERKGVAPVVATRLAAR